MRTFMQQYSLFFTLFVLVISILNLIISPFLIGQDKGEHSAVDVLCAIADVIVYAVLVYCVWNLL